MIAPGRRPRQSARLTIPLLAWGCLFFLVPASGCNRQPESPPRPLVEVTIAYPTSVSAALFQIAFQKGFFSRGGARVNALPFDSGKDALEKMISGEVDMAIAPETPVARAILNGGKLKIVAVIEQSGRNESILARKDRGISSPADLRGKAIGYTQGTSADYFLDTFLLANRIGPDDVRLVNLEPPDLRNALLDGRIDAACSWQPHIAILSDALGDRAVRFQDEYIYTEILCVVARPDFVRDHPDRLRAILEGFVSALALVTRSPAEAQAIVAAHTRIDPAIVSKVWDDHDFEVNLDQSLMTSLEDECRWLLGRGAVPASAIPDLRDFIHYRGLLDVSPDAVQMILTGAGDRR